MDNEEYRAFQILDEIGQDVIVSQRDLAGKLNISLGLVNSFIKRLMAKGYCKVVSLPKNRVKYILTPEGVAEKTRLTYNYIKHSYGLYKTSHRKLQEIFNDLSMSGIESVFFYGATDVAEIAYVSLRDTDIKLAGIIDDERYGDFFLNHEVSKLEHIKISLAEKIIITESDYYSNAMQRLIKSGVDASQIVTFD